MKKVKKLKPGSHIAVISPSNGLPSIFPGIYELGLKNLKDVYGFEIIEMPTARMSLEELYKHPELRAKDINDAFKDDKIDGIITSIGGYESVRILKHLDMDAILKNPKLIMGFSDATTFLSYINCKGMVTFYGPSIMAGLAQLKNEPEKFALHIRDLLIERNYPYTYEPYEKWTEGYRDWNNNETLGQCTDFFNNEKGWIFLQGNKETEGILWGGCIEVLEFLKGTDFWPEKGFWKDRILFFETSEEKPLPSNVGYMLRNYGIQGILNSVKGIMFGRPKDYTEKEKEELNETVLRIVRDEFCAVDIPIVMNVDFGHTDPKIILPLGCRAKITPAAKEIVLLESPFEE